MLVFLGTVLCPNVKKVHLFQLQVERVVKLLDNASTAHYLHKVCDTQQICIALAIVHM